jgi:hypothetical protein
MNALAENYRRTALMCRDLAETALTPAAKQVLMEMAVDYESKAETPEVPQAHRARPAFQWNLD